jgi:hypothetical protein
MRVLIRRGEYEFSLIPQSQALASLVRLFAVLALVALRSAGMI